MFLRRYPFILLLGLFASLSLSAQESNVVRKLTDETCGIRWARSLKAGMERAKKENKPLLVAISARKFANPESAKY